MVELSLNFTVPDGAFMLTEAAAARINQLTEMEGRVDQALTIKVKPGGCAGFMYDMSWVPVTADGKKFELDGATLIVQTADLRLLDGGELDYIEDLMGSQFKISNPNATNSCGCGKSWA
ncbi:MAG: iron-sulfur cluster assembly accessory protein [Candidatus Heimdallarchaeota archaeon]|nr:iron-sulfur cluster assembly accessory protein [Candidatus Heimdallarchaeota archaeon]